MIKVTDLMIGDWVYASKDEHTIMKVMTINGNTADCTWDVNNECDMNIDEFEPIPLTPEILVKNGFLKTDDWFSLADDYYDIDIKEISDSIWRVRYDNLECSAITNIFHICYVHEIQHALRLCGIDKEIEL